MSKENKSKTQPLIPFQVKARPEVRERIVKVADARGLSANDVASMALAAGIDRVEKKLMEIAMPEPQAA